MSNRNEKFGYSLFRKLPPEHVHSIYPSSLASPAAGINQQVNEALRSDKFIPHVNSLEDLAVFSQRHAGESDKLIYTETRGTAEDVLDVLDQEEELVPLHVEHNHHRAATLPLTEPVVDHRIEEYGDKRFETKNAYGFLNIKGLGYIFPGSYHSRVLNYQGSDNAPVVQTKHSEQYAWGDQVLGLFDKRVFESLRRSTEELIRAGARVEAIAGASQLDACYFDGELVTIDELKAKGIISGDEYEGEAFEAVEVFRLQRFPYRVKDLFDAGRGLSKLEEKKVKRKLLLEAFEALNRENEALGSDAEPYDIDSSESVRKYLIDSAYWVGKNLGIIQGLGKFVGFFNSGNTTLAKGELVDLDTLADLTASEHINIEGQPIYDKKSGITFNNFKVKKQGKTESYETSYSDVPLELLKDMRDGLTTLRRLINAVKKVSKIDKSDVRKALLDAFLSGYSEGRSSNTKLEKKNFKQLDYQALNAAVEDMAKKIIIEKRNIAPIKT